MRSSPASRRKAIAAAHGLSIQLGISEIAEALQEGLGQASLAEIVGKNPRTLARWVNGTVTPPRPSEKLLRDVFQVFEMIAEIGGESTARAWFAGMNPALDQMTPVEAMSLGSGREVMTAARGFIGRDPGVPRI